MFEYVTKKDKKVTINPKMIAVIIEGDTSNETFIYTVDSPDPIRVMETYEKVKDDFNNFMYTIQTIISVR